MKTEKLISDQQLIDVFGNANFGDCSKRDIVKYSLLKCACGFRIGYTANQILEELGLVTKKYTITKSGKEYLWASFADMDF